MLPIPPPPPAPRTKRARNDNTPTSIGRDRVKAGSTQVDALTEYDYDPENPPAGGGQTGPGCKPALPGTNFGAVTSAVGLMDATGHAWMVQRENKRTEWVGMTSKIPEVGSTPRLTDLIDRAQADR
jgi:hypothetical protein